MKSFYFAAVFLFTASVAVAQEGYVIHSINFEGNKSFSDGDLRDRILTKESPPAILQLAYRIFHLGGPPQYFDPFVLRSDLQRIRRFYEINGFFYAKVDSLINYDTADSAVDVYVRIKEGPAAYINSVSYHGLPDSTREFVGLLNEKPFLTNGIRYSASKVDLEIDRVIALLQNDGYAYARKDSSVVTIMPGNSDSVKAAINLYFVAGKKYYWGALAVLPLDSGDVSYEKHIILREMLFNSGDIYSLAKKTESEQRLDALNLFESAKIAIPSVKARPVSDTLPCSVSVKLLAAHAISLGPLVDDENNAFNFGGQVDYLERNFLGDARLFDVTTSLRLQSFSLVTFSSKVLSDTVTVGRIDASAQLTQPYFFSNRTSLTWGVSFLVDKQMPYLQLVLRNKVSISERLAEFTSARIDWDIERAKVDSLQAIPLPQGLETPQFNSIISFTLQRDETDNYVSPTKGFFNSMTLEEGGILPGLIHSAFTHLEFPYAKYWKFTLLGKWFFSLNESSTNIFALKAKVGYAQEYGTFEQDLSGPIPLNYRFFAGGSQSIRGWRTRELGDVPNPEYGGNTLLETNFEDRFRIVGDFGGVLFLDAGNLWNSYKNVTISTIAAAVGFGLRYSTFFGPLRVDFGNRLYDPEATGHQFIFQQNRTTLLRQLVVHFGIEQAF